MPIDLQRILEAAVRAAVEPPAQAAPPSRKTKKRRLSTGRAMLLGAGLATAGRLVVAHKGRDVLGRVQERIADFKGEPEGAEDYEDELEDYEPEPDDAGGDELEAEDDAPEPEPPPSRTRRRRGRA